MNSALCSKIALASATLLSIHALAHAESGPEFRLGPTSPVFENVYADHYGPLTAISLANGRQVVGARSTNYRSVIATSIAPTGQTVQATLAEDSLSGIYYYDLDAVSPSQLGLVFEHADSSGTTYTMDYRTFDSQSLQPSSKVLSLSAEPRVKDSISRAVFAALPGGPLAFLYNGYDLPYSGVAHVYLDCRDEAGHRVASVHELRGSLEASGWVPWQWEIVAQPTNHSFLVLWFEYSFVDGHEMNRLWSQSFSNECVAAAPPVPLAEFEGNSFGGELNVAADVFGRALVAWSGIWLTRVEGGGPVVFARILDLDGSPLTPVFQATADQPDRVEWQWHFDVAVGGPGAFLLAATDNGTNSGSVLLSQIDLAGIVRIPPVEVASEILGGQLSYVSTATQSSPSGRIVWADSQPIGGLELNVFTRTFSQSCLPSETVLCLDDEPGDHRFRVQVAWASARNGGISGEGQTLPLSSLGVIRGGLFWFFAPDNPEVLVKVLNACTLTDSFWVFITAGTDLGLEVTVSDTFTGISRRYSNSDGTPAQPIQDTGVGLPCTVD